MSSQLRPKLRNSEAARLLQELQLREADVWWLIFVLLRSSENADAFGSVPCAVLC